MLSKGLRNSFLVVAIALAAGFAGRRSAVTPSVSSAAAPAPSDWQPDAGIRSEGRLVAYPGAEVTVGTDRGGTLSAVLIEEGQSVRRGQLLAELDSAEERAALAEARARLAEAEASVRFL